MRTVYDNGGECLGDEFVNLAGLQPSTKEAIQQMIYLDETLNILNERTDISERKILKIVNACFHAYASSFSTDAENMAKRLLGTYQAEEEA